MIILVHRQSCTAKSRTQRDGQKKVAYCCYKLIVCTQLHADHEYIVIVQVIYGCLTSIIKIYLSYIISFCWSTTAYWPCIRGGFFATMRYIN